MSRILAVDDSVSMRQLVSFTLKNAGFDVVEAVDGKDAQAKAEASQFDLVLTDVNMPNLDGIELIRQLRGTASYRYTPMLLMTTESSEDRKAEGKKAGATGWIVKPFDPDQLVATLKRVIR